MPQHGEVFTQDAADTMRRTCQGVHKHMRTLLNNISGTHTVQPVEPNTWKPLRVEMPPDTPWRHYLAHHKQSDTLIGPGVRTLYSQFRTRNDANRANTAGNQLRLDFVVERTDGSISALHPGRTPKLDAKVHFCKPGEFQPQANFRLHGAVILSLRLSYRYREPLWR